MFRRLTGAACAFTLTLAVVTPVAATTKHHRPLPPHIVAQRTVNKGARSVYLRAGLTPGHNYRLEVVGSSRFRVKGTGFENYLYVTKKQLVQNMKPLHFQGSTPFRFAVRQPVNRKLSQWIFAVTIQRTSTAKMIVRLRDLGKIR